MVTDFKLMWKLRSELCKVKIMNSLVIKQFVNIKKFNEFKQLLSDKIGGEENLERKGNLEKLNLSLTKLKELNFEKMLEMRTLCSGFPLFAIFLGRKRKIILKGWDDYKRNIAEMKNYLNQEEELKEELAEKLRIELNNVKKMNELLRSLCSGTSFFALKKLKKCCETFIDNVDKFLEEFDIKFSQVFEMDNSNNTIKEIENKENLEMLEEILKHQLSYKNGENNEDGDKGKGILCTSLLFCGSSSYGKETPSD
uniref:Uncharacterized protein n=1 Tax=Meloidogyne floridensis TaxID=298350 RepID=A0A915NFA3_9BILA